MKRVVMEIWVTDEAAAAQESTITPDQSVLDDMIADEEGAVLGVRVTLPDGNVLRAGQTFG